MESAPSDLLMPDEPPAYQEVEGEPHSPLIFVCDHASRRVPRALDNLGLSEDELCRHIGWDIGAAELTRTLAGRFAAPAVMSSYSRLVADCNRYMHDPAFAPAEIDGTRVPANAELTPEALEIRAREIHRPYHDAIERRMETFAAAGRIPILVSVHTFTPHPRTGEARAWHIGVSWTLDDRVSAAVLSDLAGRPGIVVGDNLPYELEPEEDYTVPVHAMRRGWPHLQIEFRQDLVSDIEGVLAWAGVLGDVLESLAGRDHIHHALSPPPVTAVG